MFVVTKNDKAIHGSVKGRTTPFPPETPSSIASGAVKGMGRHEHNNFQRMAVGFVGTRPIV